MQVKLNSIDGISRYVNLIEYSKTRFTIPYVNMTIDKHGYKRTYYVEYPMFLDTETAHNHAADKDDKRCWIYQWCLEFNGIVVGGRKPSELMAVFKKFIKLYDLGDKRKLVIYIHNLSYDIAYLYSYLKIFGEPKILAIKPHKILTFEVGGLLFKCSYLLSNRSLIAWNKYTKSPVEKIVNGIDYSLIRYQDTPLDNKDWEYQVNDVLSMKYSFNNMLSMFNDDIVSIPLTNTGYIRRDVRKSFKSDKRNRELFIKSRLTVDTYKILRRAFAGGLSHGNRHYIGRLINAKIAHYDYKSMYPSQQILRYFPTGAFELYYRNDGKHCLSKTKLDELCTKYCVVMSITFDGLYIRDENITLPCVSVDKCNKGRTGDTPLHYTIDGNKRGNDNGKVLFMDGRTTLCLTELDYYWIKRQYKTNRMRINTVYIAQRAKHPTYVLENINKYFKIKESASGIERDKAKNNLNAGYGMEATDPVRVDYSFDMNSCEWIHKAVDDDTIIEEKLDKFYKSRNSFMQFYYGVYVTSWSRYQLLEMVEAIGYDRFIYADTDSIYFIDSPNSRQIIEKYNKRVIEYNIKHELGVSNKNGNVSYYGVFEDEGEHITAFKFLHSKCYGYVIDGEDIKLTIAGVRKEILDAEGNIYTSVDELSEFGKIRNPNDILDNLSDSFVFERCGGVSATYIYGDVRQEIIHGHLTELSGGCIIQNISKTMSEIEWLKSEDNGTIEIDTDLL